MNSQSQDSNDSQNAQNALKDSLWSQILQLPKMVFMADLRERSAECAENAAQAAIAHLVYSHQLSVSSRIPKLVCGGSGDEKMAAAMAALRYVGRTTLSGGRCVFPYPPHPLPEVLGRGENTKCGAEKRLFPARKSNPPFSVVLPICSKCCNCCYCCTTSGDKPVFVTITTIGRC